jgi:hypothetical protein
VHGEIEAHDDLKRSEPDLSERCLVVVGSYHARVESVPLAQPLDKPLEPAHEIYSHHAEHQGGGSQVEGLTGGSNAG